MKSRACELCDGEASLFCPSDSAFLCSNCDSKVHGDNFLVARHVRRTVCSNCSGLTDNRVSGVGFELLRQICRSCLPEFPGEDLDSLSSSSSSSSDCISSTESSAKKKIDFDRLKMNRTAVSDISGENSNIPATTNAINHDRKPKVPRSRAPSSVDSKAEGILVNWCRKLGMGGNACTVAMASRAFGVRSEEFTALPLRVSLAASLWLSFRLCGDRSASTWQILRGLEEISGVPAKLILAAESKLARVLKTRRTKRQHQQHQQEEEGWAECSV